MATNPQSRKWMLTINNPQVCELDRERIRQILSLFHPSYYCMADEIATTGTYHTHIFLYSTSPIRFNTVKTRFPTAHIEKALGSATQNRDYIQKGGKWEDDNKAETIYLFGNNSHLPTEAYTPAPTVQGYMRYLRYGSFRLAQK